MLKKIIEFIESLKAKKSASINRELRDSFDITERDGTVYIIHRYDAIYEVNPKSTIEETIMQLEKFRNASIDFRKVK